jgi:hypothetical protein
VLVLAVWQAQCGGHAEGRGGEADARAPDGTARDGGAFDGGASDGEVVDSAMDAAVDGAAETGAPVALTVNVRAFGAASGSVMSNPAGISCAAPCSQTLTLPAGSTVTLAAEGGSHIWWGPGCSGPLCTVKLDVARSLTVTFSDNNYVFVTANSYPGNLGGLAGGDSMCQQSAAASGLPGTYVAWLATSTTNALGRLGTARGWIRPDGLPFADTVGASGGTTGIRHAEIFYPPEVDQFGHRREANAWTAAQEDGSFFGGAPNAGCADWTSNDPTVSGLYGLSSCGSVGWTFAVNGVCSDAAPIYCFGVDLAAPLTIPPVPVRHAFLSAGVFLPVGSIGTADALCQGEAARAGLPNASRFLGLLATTGQSAVARFDLSGLDWARPDGTLLASSPTAFANGALDAALTEHADGTYISDWVYARTGATSATALGSGATCNDWSSSASTDMGYSGSPVDTNFTWFGAQGMPCSQAQPVYCLEQ